MRFKAVSFSGLPPHTIALLKLWFSLVQFSHSTLFFRWDWYLSTPFFVAHTSYSSLSLTQREVCLLLKTYTFSTITVSQLLLFSDPLLWWTQNNNLSVPKLHLFSCRRRRFAFPVTAGRNLRSIFLVRNLIAFGSKVSFLRWSKCSQSELKRVNGEQWKIWALVQPWSDLL